MTHVEDTIRDFCSGMGIRDVLLNRPDCLTLEIQNTGRFSIESDNTSGTVLISLSKPLSYLTEEETKTILEATHYRQRYPWFLHAALGKNDEVAFIVRLAAHEFTVQSAYEILDFLRQQHQGIRPR
jgi:type III secretion system chaperone SycN